MAINFEIEKEKNRRAALESLDIVARATNQRLVQLIFNVLAEDNSPNFYMSDEEFKNKIMDYLSK